MFSSIVNTNNRNNNTATNTNTADTDPDPDIDIDNELPALESGDTDNIDIEQLNTELSNDYSNNNSIPIRQSPTIQSIHCSCELGLSVIDLRLLAYHSWNSIYDPRRVNGCLIQLRNPKSSSTVFSSGKLINLGCRNRIAAITACRKICRIIQKVPGLQNCSFKQFEIHNISATGCLGFPIDLFAIQNSIDHCEFSDYEPDQFPGLYYRLPVAFLTPEQTIAYNERKSINTARLAAERTQRELDEQYMTLGERMQAGYSTAQSEAKAKLKAKRESAAATAEPVITICLFYSGKFTITGAKSEFEVSATFELLSQRLWPFAQLSKFGSEVPIQSYQSWLEWADKLSIVNRNNIQLIQSQSQQQSHSQYKQRSEWRELAEDRQKSKIKQKLQEQIKSESALTDEIESKSASAINPVIINSNYLESIKREVGIAPINTITTAAAVPTAPAAIETEDIDWE